MTDNAKPSWVNVFLYWVNVKLNYVNRNPYWVKQKQESANGILFSDNQKQHLANINLMIVPCFDAKIQMKHPDTSGNQACKSLTSKYAIKPKLLIRKWAIE